MCGRLVSAQPPAVIAAQFDVDEVVVDTLPPRYNVAPTAVVPAVATTRSGRRLGAMSWGLVPPWADDPLTGPRPVNARAETIAEKPLSPKRWLGAAVWCPLTASTSGGPHPTAPSSRSTSR